jgi:ABC-type glycerol-3-phosphate transport system permease component
LSIRTARGAFHLLKYLAVVAVVVFAIGPLVWIMLASLKPGLGALAYPPEWFFTPSLEHFRELLGSGDSIPLAKAFFNSVAVTTVSTVLTLLIACPAAYSLARLKPRGGKGLLLFVIATRMLPPIVLVVPIFQIMHPLGLQDTLTALVVPYTGLAIPLAIWMMHGFFMDLPKELEEAAMIDGCTRLTALWHVVLPIAAPGLAATAIFTGLLAWNDLVFALPLTTVDATTLPVVASRMRAEEGVMWGQLGAVATVMVVPTMVLVFFIQRYIVRGLGAGAVKG